MAARLKSGLRETLSRQEVPGHVHGVSSIFHVALGVEGETNDEGISQLPHDQTGRRNRGTEGRMLKVAMFNEGVDMFGDFAFLTSAAHPEQQIDLINILGHSRLYRFLPKEATH